jgi:hypothetical protein
MKIEKCASVLNVSYLTASFAWFKKIGREKNIGGMKSLRYWFWENGDHEIFLCLD